MKTTRNAAGRTMALLATVTGLMSAVGMVFEQVALAQSPQFAQTWVYTGSLNTS